MTKLVCVVGTGNYSETNYYFREEQKKTRLAPVAVGYCTEAQGYKELTVLALLTEEAESKHEVLLEKEVKEEGWDFEKIRIPSGESEAELWEIFRIAGEHLEENDDVILDLTHGFRHLPALLLAAIQYHAVRKKLNILGIYYGAFDRDNDATTRILDLTPLHDLSEWVYSVKLLDKYQFSAPIGDMLNRIQRRSYSNANSDFRYRRLQKLGRSLQALEPPLISGIPLEAGLAARKALEDATSAEDEVERVPPMKEPLNDLKIALDAYALSNKDKPSVQLDLEELSRQSDLISGYLRTENLWAAANLLREWIVSSIIFHSGDVADWLDYGTRRKPVERRLGVFSKWIKSDLKDALTENQKMLIGHWQSVSDKRNALAHAGMRKETLSLRSSDFENAFTDMKSRLKDESFWNTDISGKTDDVWLVSPLGNNPGALFTALMKIRPDHLVVVTSEQCRELIPEILQKSGCEDLVHHVLLLDDPFNDFQEGKKRTREMKSRYGHDWIRADRIILNLTGGTTCLGWTVDQIGRVLERMGLEPEIVACVDRRTAMEQTDNPYVEGDLQHIRSKDGQ